MKNRITQKIANLILSALFILLFVFSDTALNAAQKALTVCVSSVIPSLFPFMVLSGLIVRRRLLAPLERFLPVGKLFRLPSAAAGPFLLGALCGFPIGAKSSAELYRQGILTKEEAERTCAVSNNTGPAFTVCIAGGFFWKSYTFGRYLYFMQILSAITVGALLGIPYKKNKKPTESPESLEESSIRSFADSVTSAASAILPLAGYVVFFSVVSALIKELLPSVLPTVFLCTILEFTSGIGEAAQMGGLWGRFLTGFALGFSGLSVFVQSYSFTAELGLSLRKTFLTKWLQGILCGLLCTLYPLFFS